MERGISNMNESKAFCVEDVYGNHWWDFTEESYDEFTRKGIQLKRQISKDVWRRNAPWKRSVWWDDKDEDDPETSENYQMRKEDEWYSAAVYLYDVDGIDEPNNSLEEF